MQEIHAEKKHVVVWGSGSKCVSFLTTLNLNKYVVDINPHRHGKFIIGAGKKTMPLEFLKKYEPDVTILMNSGHCLEIKQMLDYMKVKYRLSQFKKMMANQFRLGFVASSAVSISYLEL